MRVLFFIEDPPVARPANGMCHKILDHLGLWDAQQRPPPPTIEPIALLSDVLSWVAEDPYPYDQSALDFNDLA
jgi:hypothetical protein